LIKTFYPFPGRKKLAEGKGFSEEMAWRIAQETTAIIRHGEEIADELLQEDRPRPDALATAQQEEECQLFEFQHLLAFRVYN
jgi:cell division protease FtsH